MNSKITVKPDTIYLEDLLVDVARGEYKIPVFQRDFVWRPNQMIDLFDSIIKGYPIGSLLFWSPTEKFETKVKIGPYKIDNSLRSFSYVLDGFQRISTLFGVLTNPNNYTENTDNKEQKDFLLFFDIKDSTFHKVKRNKSRDVFVVPVYIIYDNIELFNLIREIEKEDISNIEKAKYIENARQLHNILHKYRMPYVTITGGDIKSAVDIFSRINSEGTRISEDFLFSALNYNSKSGFLLADKITEILDNFSKYNFKDLKRDTIFNCIINSTGKPYFDVKDEELKDQSKYNLELLTERAILHIQEAVKFLYMNLNVIHSKYLPYPTQFIFISEYFRINPYPSAEQLIQLEKWFWITTYSNYFSIYSLSQQRSAYYEFISSIQANNDLAIYKVNEMEDFSTLKFPTKIDFTSVRTKALQVFMLKRLYFESPPETNGGVIEQFIFNLGKGRNRIPANIIFRNQTEFESNSELKEIEMFIYKLKDEDLDKYYINNEMKDLFMKIRSSQILDLNVDADTISQYIEQFLLMRRKLIIEKELDFVSSLSIDYVLEE